jgi:hypothetical protein
MNFPKEWLRSLAETLDSATLVSNFTGVTLSWGRSLDIYALLQEPQLECTLMIKI